MGRRIKRRLNPYIRSVRLGVRDVLRAFGLLYILRRFNLLLAHTLKSELSRIDRDNQRFLQFKEKYADVLRHRLFENPQTAKNVLIVSIGFPGIEIELAFIKAFEMAGFNPVILLLENCHWLDEEYYRIAGIKDILAWNDFLGHADYPSARAQMQKFQSIDELLSFESDGARVGRSVFSTLIRSQRLGSFDLNSDGVRKEGAGYLSHSLRYTKAINKVLEKINPEYVLLVDGVYTPESEIQDICLSKNIKTIMWHAGHKSNSLIFKRYTKNNRHEHPMSLSDDTWKFLCEMKWTASHSKAIRQEFHDIYASGDWYSQHGTQFDKRMVEVAEIKKQLGLDPQKKTAIIFPHILWDASLSWGQDLFRNYEEWLIETVRAACQNDKINWIIKIHPAHVGKSAVENFKGEPAEVVTLRKHIGELPPHIFFIPAHSDISTFSLFEMMDYGVTVRGTIGIEAPTFGVPVLTAGTGRYDGRGFTVDSDSREQYLEKIANIQDIPPLSEEQQNKAERFAYGLFLLRPLLLETVTLEFRDKKEYLSETKINVKDKHGWLQAPDLKVLANWLANSEKADFISPANGQF